VTVRLAVPYLPAMRPVGLVLVLATAGALAGCGGAAKVQAPSGPDHALLSSIVSGMKTDLVSVRIGTPKAEWGRPASRRLKFLYVTPRTTRSPQSVAEDWYTTLIAGAYEAQCGRRSADCLLGYSTQGIEGSRMHATRIGPPRVNGRTLARQIRSRFEQSGLHVTSVTFERPYGLAPVVTVISDQPQRAVTAFYRASPFLRLPVEGFLVRMVDRRGRLFLIDGGSFRTKEGSGWTRPDLRVPNEIQPATP
jgi:hypothetical protein